MATSIRRCGLPRRGVMIRAGLLYLVVLIRRSQGAHQPGFD